MKTRMVLAVLAMLASGMAMACSINTNDCGPGQKPPPPPPTKLVQAINFATIAPQVLSGGVNGSNNGGGSVQSVALAAQASSGLAVTFKSNTGQVCMVSGSSARLVAVGTCTVVASQGGNAAYLPAPDATQSFSVSAVGSGVSGLVWTHVGCVGEWWGGCVQGSYTSFTIEGNGIKMFSNLQDLYGTNGDLYTYAGTWGLLQSPADVLHVSVPSDTFIRTSGIAKGNVTPNYYAVLYTGNAYPGTNGYSPSWATSPDGYSWTWFGPITMQYPRSLGSGMNLIVDETRGDSYRFMAWNDFSLSPSGFTFALFHSATGLTNDWQSDGANIWPIAGEQPLFAGAARTPFGYHIIAANMFDGTSNRALRHIFSCTGMPGTWHVIEMASPIGVTGSKGAILTYDAATSLLHAVVGGQHFTLPARNFVC